MVKVRLHSTSDPSSWPTLLLRQIQAVFSVVAPCPRGASLVSVQRRTFTFRSETVSKPIHFATITGNEVACCFEPEDVDTFLKGLDSPETAKAMAFDGVKRETVKVFVLDKEFKV